MRSRFVPLAALTLLACTALACSLGSSPTPAAQPSAVPVGTATMPPLAPGTMPPGAMSPLATIATNVPLIIAATATASVTDTPTPTATLAAPAATVPPKTSGPLGFQVSIAGCRIDPSRQGGVILSMRIDATGGNGVYTYYHEGQQVQRTFDRPATKGFAVIDAFRVTSGDGQTLQQKLRFTGAQFGCP